jgi:cytosine/adenosine deaminase-related metal-dependent hydrolase
MATEMGARAVFPQQVIGRLEAGAKADIIAIHIADIPTPVNSSNLFDQLILFRNPGNVQDVIVDGEFRKKDFQLLSGNLETAWLEVHSYAKRLWEKGASLAQRMHSDGGSHESV